MAGREPGSPRAEAPAGAEGLEARHRRWRALDPDLPPDALPVLDDLLAELARWNARIRLTAPASPEELALRVVDDSLLLLPFLRGPTLVDVGSGPGIPGLVLAAVRPGLAVATVEPIAKKTAFTRAFLARHPGLDVRVHTARVEPDRPGPWGPAATVVSRAFTAPREWVALGAGLVAPGGRLLVTLGRESGEEADSVAAARGLVFAGAWRGQLAGVSRGIRAYDRPPST